MNRMNDKIAQEQFLNFMNVDGRPIVSVQTMDWLIGQGFFVKPAAIKHHGNHTGGLFEHSMMVAQVLVEMTQKFDIPWTRPESPYIVGMLHDVCKLDDYFDENASDAGHGDKSVMMLSQVMTLTEEEMLCIRFHMGAYVTSEWDAFDRAIRKYQSVLFTHTADMYASKVKDV